MPKYNLGCGILPMPGFVNVDYCEYQGVDKVMDLNKKWDIADDDADEIVANHVIEHVDDILHFMSEARRVLKSGGMLTLSMPFGNSLEAMVDYTHKRPIWPETFGDFIQGDPTLERTRSLQHKDMPKFIFIDCTANYNDKVRKYPKVIRSILYKFRNVFFNIVMSFQIRFKKP